MVSPGAGGPSRVTGLPPGVEPAPLGRRFVGYLVDSLVPAVVGSVLGALLPTSSGSLPSILVGVGGLLTLAWWILLWFQLAVQAATPGMRLMKLQLVGFYDGRPIGWGRVLVRALLLWLFTASGLGLVLLLVFLLLQPRHQGWHDLATKAVMIKARALAPRSPNQPVPAAQPVAVGSGPAPVGPPLGYGAPPGYGPQQPAAYRPQPAPLAPPPGMPVGAPPGYAPAPAGPPPAPSLAPPAGVQQPPQARPAPVPAAVAEPTAILPSPAENGPVRWVAALDDGREIDLVGLVLLGRNPQAEPGEEDAQLIKIADETRTVSKSHLAISNYENLIYVTDRGSTNGSTLTTAAGVSSRCNPGEWVPAAEGSIVSIGDHWLEIRHPDR